MPEHEHILCARCGTGFECKPGTVQQCQCFEVPLTAAECERIGEYYEGCLCSYCLRTLRAALKEKGAASG